MKNPLQSFAKPVPLILAGLLLVVVVSVAIGRAPQASRAAALIGDLDGDGIVGVGDLSILLANWGKRATTATPTPTPAASEVKIQAYTTAYTYYDNTPPGSADISHPVIHTKAAGTGTYADPITIAVGHTLTNGNDILDYPKGTKFYIPNVRRYFIVEDTCGDGATPQNGPCHTGYPSGTTSWVDLWIDGAGGTEAAVNACASLVTDSNGVAHTIIKNPASNYLVVSGPVFQNGKCTLVYGNTAVTQ